MFDQSSSARSWSGPFVNAEHAPWATAGIGTDLTLKAFFETFPDNTNFSSLAHPEQPGPSSSQSVLGAGEPPLPSTQFLDLTENIQLATDPEFFHASDSVELVSTGLRGYELRNNGSIEKLFVRQLVFRWFAIAKSTTETRTRFFMSRGDLA